MEYEHHVYYHNWSGIEIQQSAFEEIFKLLDPIGIHGICLVDNADIPAEMRSDEFLTIGFACPAFRSSFDPAPVARRSREYAFRNRRIDGERHDSMAYYIFKTETVFQSPGIMLPCDNISFDVPTTNQPRFLAQVHHKNVINLAFSPYESVWQHSSTAEIKHASLVRLLTKVIHIALPYLQLSESDFRETAAVLAEKNLLHIIAESSMQQNLTIQNQLLNHYTEKRQKEEQLAELHHTIKRLEAELDAVSNTSFAAARRFTEEIEKIKALRMVDSVDAYSKIVCGIFSFTTKNIYAKTQGRKYYLGSFKVECNIFKHTVSFFQLEENMKRKSHWGMHCHHPHVSEIGNACLGNVSTDFRTAFENQQYGYLAVLCLSFLSSVNIDDVAGRQIINWPLADKDGNIVKDPAGGLLTCKRCGKRLPEDDNELEESCFQCAVCEAWYHKSCVQHHHVGANGLILCDDCHSVGAGICSVCGQICPGRRLETNSITNGSICADCSTRITVASDSSTVFQSTTAVLNADESAEDWSHIAECACCHRLFIRQDNADTMCPYCQNPDTSIVHCHDCGQYLPEAQTIEYETRNGDIRVCFDCANDYVICEDLTFARRDDCVQTPDGNYHYQETEG